MTRRQRTPEETELRPAHSPQIVKNALNSHLRTMTPQVVVRAARFVPSEFHARYSKINKTYVYKLKTVRTKTDLSPVTPYGVALLPDRTWNVPDELDVVEMHKGAQAVSQREEFSSVILPHTSRDVVEISITADGFLYKMVRNIVGLLYRVGSGRLSADEVPKILEARDRRCVTGCAPAEGLYLVHIQYHPPLF
eukprot:c20232_g1_i6.p1 GENE.c20232_g1_i6~~c20232_g1_i6.p1  ORF type:complete len:194 (+),score=30.96 c20232_g1_i6:278-859(+)